MHLLATMPGTIADGAAAVDLAQTPGDIVVLSSADTELALLAAAQQRRRATDTAAPRLRLAPILRLGHNFSVDLYMETVGAARLVVARILGGSGYWPYGVERLVETCREHGIALALLPGDDKPDRELAELSTIPAESRHRLWRYLAEGGPANADNFLRYAGSLIGRETAWAEPAPLLRAGLYWPGLAVPSLADIAARWRCSLPRESRGGIVPIVFYRALVQSGNTAPVDALAEALTARRLRPLPVYVQSLKDGEAAALLASAVRRGPAGGDPERDRVFGAGGGGGGPAGGGRLPGIAGGVFGRRRSELAQRHARPGTARPGDERRPARDRRPHPGARGVVQGAAGQRAAGQRAAGQRRDAPLGRDPETEVDLVGYRPVADRVGFVADLARGWAELRRKPPSERRVALILANYPNRDGRIGNGVGLDTPASAIAVTRALAVAGYRIGDMPGDPQALIERLLAGPTNANPARRGRGNIFLCRLFGVLRDPCPVGSARRRRALGAGRARPVFREGRLDAGGLRSRVSLRQCRDRDPAGARLQHRPESDLPRPGLGAAARLFAAYAWLAQEFRADAIIHLGKHGTLEWLPGKALALSAECFPKRPCRHCRISTRLSSTTPAKARRPSAAPRRYRRSSDPAARPRRQLS